METKKNKPSFVMHSTMWPAIKDLPDESMGKLFRAIMEYNIDGVIPEEAEPELLMAFAFFKARFDVDYNKWIERCRINKEIADKRKKGKSNNES